LLAQKFEIVFAFHSGSICKHPGWIMLYAGIHAGLRRRARTLNPAFYVRSKLKRGAKQLLLALAMWTPERAVHLGSLCTEALRKSVQTVGVLMAPKKEQAHNYRDNQDRNSNLLCPGIRRVHLLPLLLSSSSFF
jgi:hypothetical protein